jgi:hypothetical protein
MAARDLLNAISQATRLFTHWEWPHEIRAEKIDREARTVRHGGYRVIGGASAFDHLPKFKPSSLLSDVYVRLTLARVTP